MLDGTQCRSERSEEPLRLHQRPFAIAQGITARCVTSVINLILLSISAT